MELWKKEVQRELSLCYSYPETSRREVRIGASEKLSARNLFLEPHPAAAAPHLRPILTFSVFYHFAVRPIHSSLPRLFLDSYLLVSVFAGQWKGLTSRSRAMSHEGLPFNKSVRGINKNLHESTMSPSLVGHLAHVIPLTPTNSMNEVGESQCLICTSEDEIWRGPSVTQLSPSASCRVGLPGILCFPFWDGEVLEVLLGWQTGGVWIGGRAWTHPAHWGWGTVTPCCSASLCSLIDW